MLSGDPEVITNPSVMLKNRGTGLLISGFPLQIWSHANIVRNITQVGAALFVSYASDSDTHRFLLMLTCVPVSVPAVDSQTEHPRVSSRKVCL